MINNRSKGKGKAKLCRAAATLLAWTMLVPAGLGAGTPAFSAAAGPLVVYDEALSSEFVNYGWAEMDEASTTQAHTGSRSVRLNPDGGKALYFYKDRILNADDYTAFRFWIHGGSTGGQKLKLVFSLGGQPVAEREVESLLPGGIPAGKWAEVQVNLRELGIQGLLDGIWLWGDGDQEDVYIDDMTFVSGSTGPGPSPTPTPTPTPTPSPSPTPTRTSSPGQPPSVTELLFGQEQLILNAGDSQAATVTARLSNGTLQDVTAQAVWSSADAAIATVAGGVVTGVKAGSTVIRAVYGTREAQLPVQVKRTGPAAPIETIDGLYVYDDSIQTGFTDYSWAEHSVNEEGTVHTGTQSIRFAPQEDRSLYFYSDRIISTKEFEKLQLWVNGGSAGGQEVKVVLTAGGQAVQEIPLTDVLGGAIPAGVWTKAEILLPGLNLPGQIFDGIRIAGTTSGSQAALYLDDIALIKKYIAPPTVLEVRMDRSQLVLLPGETHQLEAESWLETGNTEVVTAKAEWQSDRPDIVRVDRGALVAVAPGIARITATHKSLTAVAYVQVTQVAPENVYDDALQNGFRNQSWHDKDLTNTEQTHGGSYAVKFEPDGWDGVWFAADRKRSVSGYYGVDFWLYGGTTGGQKLMLHAYNGGSGQGAVDLSNYVPGGSIPAGVWTHFVINFADMGLRNEDFDGLIFQAATEDNQAAVYIDDVSLLRNVNAGQLPEPELPKLKVTVDMQAERRAINPEIYGINFDDAHPTESTLNFPVQRWGGNNTTRYNWELDVANRASDWYFMNFPYDTDPAGTMSDRFIDMVHAKQGKVLLTIPTIGWTPKSREVTWGFSQSKYGTQQSSPLEYPDAGNGVLKSTGKEIANNDPRDTSIPVGVDFATRWIDHIAGRTGNLVHYYALDNEPEIWHVTHRDVHPQAPTYDELWGFTEKYASAIKAKDSQAQIFGPTSWGWCAYFYSSADNCADGPDRQAHGGQPFLEWYLQKAAAYKQSTGVSLIHYLDIHYYSQEPSVPGFDEGPAAAKRRFQALKALYDPNFVDDSWIQEPIRLIPRMKDIIAKTKPDTKLAITEYNFGNGNGITAGLAQAEALAIFGREGVDLATRFGTLRANTPLEDAFKLFLNYDGQGGQIRGSSVPTTSKITDAVGAYTIAGTDGKTYVLLFNKDTALRSIDVAGAFHATNQAQVYRFDANNRLALSGTLATTSEGFTVHLNARSAALIVIP